MNKDELEETVRFAQHANALLNMQLLKLQESLPKNEYREVAQSFGKTMAEIYSNILEPIYKEHDCLKPKEMGGSASKIPDLKFEQVFELITSQARRR